MRTLVLASVLLALPVLAGAQQTSDPRWAPWLGCWELVLENAGDSFSRPPARRESSPGATGSVRPQVCVEPVPGGARFSTKVGTQTPVERTVRADGAEHPVTDADCGGSERTEWAQNGRSLYANADLTCSADTGRRRVSGLSILGANGSWLDVQAVDISGQQTVRVRRYRRASDTLPARRSEPTPLTLDEVKDAAAHVSSRAIEAALVETHSTFRLSGKELIALQDAQVPASVTDLMIALSYPDKFVVERTAWADLAPTVIIDDPFFLGWAFGYPTWSDFYGFYSPLYGPYSPYFYSPFAYSYLRGYDPRFLGGGYIVIDGGGGSPSIRPSGAGRVVDGRGYTRVGPREASATASTQPLSGSVSSTSDGGSSSSGGGSSSSSGGSSVSSQGFSSGGGGDTGRTAQPR